jgi:hypothetical protein
LISKITGIDADIFGPVGETNEEFLLNRTQRLRSKSIARRMSWAANRVTTRSEDISYCLLGIFNVQMPLLYGEGETKAFFRLQEEIIKSSADQSILAWSPLQKFGPNLRGVFALNPRDFSHADAIVPLPFTGDVYSLTDRGVQIQLKILPRRRYVLEPQSIGVQTFWGVLQCHEEDNFTGPLAIPLVRQQDQDAQVFLRDGYAQPETLDGTNLLETEQTNDTTVPIVKELSSMTIFMPKDPQITSRTHCEYIQVRQCPDNCIVITTQPEYGWNPLTRTMHIEGAHNFANFVGALVFHYSVPMMKHTAANFTVGFEIYRAESPTVLLDKVPNDEVLLFDSPERESYFRQLFLSQVETKTSSSLFLGGSTSMEVKATITRERIMRKHVSFIDINLTSHSPFIRKDVRD